MAVHDVLSTTEDDIDAEPAMLAAVQLIERASELFEGGRQTSTYFYVMHVFVTVSLDPALPCCGTFSCWPQQKHSDAQCAASLQTREMSTV